MSERAPGASSPVSTDLTWEEPRGSRLDDWWERVSSSSRIQWAWHRGAPLAVLGVAAATRLIGLGSPSDIVFDETYYVKDSWTLWNLGYEGSWGPDADTAFEAGLTDTYDDAPSFIAHPPLGKWIIALGLAASHAGDPFFWRLSVAIAGIALVAVVMGLARLLLRSTLLTVIAGGLLAIDGNAIVMSRVALLDGILALFCALGVLFVVLDRRRTRERLDHWASGHPRGPDGLRARVAPVFGRPWLLAAALAFGAATSVKWSGMYALAAFGLLTVIADAIDRRRAGVGRWPLDAVRQGVVNFVTLVPLAAAVHLTSWTGWFVTDGGYYRHWAEETGVALPDGPLRRFAAAAVNWWHYQSAMYGYHVSESSPHPYQSDAATWLLMTRPVSFHYEEFGDGTASAVLDIANPLIWWAGAAAIVAVLVMLVLRLRRGATVWPEAVLVTGMVGLYLPWLLYPERTMFWFYTIVFEPFLVLAIALVIGRLLGSPRRFERHRTAALTTVGVFLGLCVVLSAFFWPLWSGQTTPIWFLRLHYWFTNWI